MYRIFSMFLLCLTFGRLSAQGIFDPVRVDIYDYTTCTGSKAFFHPIMYYATDYRWIVSADNGQTWDTVRNGSSYEGAYTDQLVIYTQAAFDNYKYCMVGLAGGNPVAYTNVATLHLGNYPPGQPYNVYVSPTTFCQGSDPNAWFNVRSLYADTLLFTYSSSGMTYTKDIRDVPDQHLDTTGYLHFDQTASSGTLTLVGRNACGTSAPVTIPVTMTPLSATLAGTGTCATYTITPGGNIYSDASSCSPMNAVTPSGASPVTGDITSCVTVDPSIQSYNGIPYVQRRYNIDPSTNASTSTATLTLYYTQSDFDSYNTSRGSNPSLPNGPSDATGIANLRITQFHGTGTTPGTYAGGSGEIDPDDNKIVWNAGASRWEITFDIVGFSGFFASGSSLITPLPLTLTAFSGRSTTDGNQLRWTTASEENTATFEIQRSDNAIADNFRTISTIPAAGNSRQPLDYTYTDPNPPHNAAISYRLRMTDLDGSFTFSRIVLLQSNAASLALRILPNPSKAPQSIAVHTAQTGKATLTITDLGGKLILRKNLVLQAGDNSLDASPLHELQQGIYLMTIQTDTQKQTIKFIKE